jgi:predicted transcriptional regulator
MDLTPDTTKAVATTVTRLLAEAGIPQREASARTGIPMTTLYRRLSGNAAFDVDELARIGRLLDVSVAAIVTHAEAVA